MAGRRADPGRLERIRSGSARMRADGVAELGTEAAVRNPGTVGAAEEPPGYLDAVPDNAAVAMFAAGGKFCHSAFKAVKGVFLATYNLHLERHPVVVTAGVAPGHRPAPSRRSRR
ncbi:hypothetical protein Francci3_1238 [Frankia casuarinae]|uniref:Uncharacterized protein n=1 Tax=Frankia casuarinae (strain DSM 45818 / CECT 9043 / HFP020203 / CcI3) TaxID=106370 RepID=Q2JDM6_FRACC|nr:hypothetical protein Francci3_1238 [Frankia casuarinae]